MDADRIVSEISFSYKATNSKGEVTLELKPTTLIIADQSPEKASAHLIAIIGGITAPAHVQASAGQN